MYRKRFSPFLSVFLGCVMIAAGTQVLPGLEAQEIEKIIDLEDGDTIPDFPFGMTLSRDGSRLAVAVAGDIFGGANHRIVTIDTSMDTIAGEGMTGSFPEEIALRYAPSGAVEKVFVSNSNDGTVSVLNPDLTPSGIVDLKPAQGAYPFGLLMGPAGRYLYVSTVDAGEIFRIDTAPGSTYLQIVDTYHIDAAFNGRMALYDGKLVVPGTDILLGAVLTILDPENPSQAETAVLEGHNGIWAGANDVAVVGSMAYVPVMDYSFHNLLYEVDLAVSPPAVSRTISLSPTSFTLLEHGIGASPDGNTLAVTSLDGLLQIAGRKAGRFLLEVDLTAGGTGAGNEAVFSRPGDKLYVSDQSDTHVYVLTGIPQHGLYLEGTESAPLGGSVDLALAGGEGGREGALLASLKTGTIVMPGFTLDLGLPVFNVFSGFFDQDGLLAVPPLTVPPSWTWLSGRTVYFQGLARDGDGEIRPSNRHELSVF